MGFVAGASPLPGPSPVFAFTTATQPKGKEEDFRLFIALLDSDSIRGEFHRTQLCRQSNTQEVLMIRLRIIYLTVVTVQSIILILDRINATDARGEYL